MNEQQRRYFPSIRGTIRSWKRFSGLVQERLRWGARHDEFSRDPLELIRELQDTSIDLAAQSFALHAKLKDAEHALRESRILDASPFRKAGR